ncbi:hypothetical protein KY359_06020 [Candidatus Woesearchaeota archaeon]|nr:hypothetical protein [Candidatus Woesearchaeota archaeon]
MEEEEIDLWYEEEKQKLSEEYIKSIDAGMNIEKREKTFNKAMDVLSRKYARKHQRLREKGRSRDFRRKMFKALAFPVVMPWRAMLWLLRFAGSAIAYAVRSKCASAQFNASVMWIKNGYKLTDGAVSMARPFHFFYIKHIQMPLLILTRPFVRFGAHTKKKTEEAKQAMISAAKLTWKYSKACLKSLTKRSSNLSKSVSCRYDSISKRAKGWKDNNIRAIKSAAQHLKSKKELGDGSAESPAADTSKQQNI